ncbi:MAG: hypothetical protein O3A51_01930 [Verrucomicrobia bacterium]|nr:hypothetical protein [Verrucomicrobiota bacterium]
MNAPAPKQAESNEPRPAKQPGFFGRLAQKLDKAMKQKAEETSQQRSCCGDSQSKGNKCC